MNGSASPFNNSCNGSSLFEFLYSVACLEFQSRSSVQFSPLVCAGLGSALIANPETIVWARTGVSDMLLTGCREHCCPFFLGYVVKTSGTSALVSFLCADRSGNLDKGPVGIVLPGLIIGRFCFTW